MQLVDTHCHIQDADRSFSGEASMYEMWQKAERPDPDDMIHYARIHNVTRMICVGTTLKDSQTAVAFVQSRSACWAAIGLHPHEASSELGILQGLRQLLGGSNTHGAEESKIVAIGECGLDYFYQRASKADQERALRFQVELALEYKLPMIFHIREAFDDFWRIVDDYQGIRGILHSFTDSKANLDKALSRGLCIGVNGIVTFTKHDWQLDMVKHIPSDRLLFETDSPFLTPKPLRGKVNEPAHIELIAKFVAKLRQESLESIAAATTNNALKFFSI